MCLFVGLLGFCLLICDFSDGWIVDELLYSVRVIMYFCVWWFGFVDRLLLVMVVVLFCVYGFIGFIDLFEICFLDVQLVVLFYFWEGGVVCLRF